MKLDISKPFVKFFACLILASIMLFMLLCLSYTGSFLPRLMNRQAWHFSQEELHQGLNGFILTDRGGILSITNNPWIVLQASPDYDGNIIHINISELSKAVTYARIFYAFESELFNERNVTSFMLRNGVNTVILPSSGYAAFRLDLTHEPNVFMVVNGVELTNYVVLSSRFWVIFFVLLLVCTIVMYLAIFRASTVSRFYKKFQDYVVYNVISNANSESIRCGGAVEKSDFLELFKQPRFYWTCVTITTVLSYGFRLSNISMMSDDLVMEHNYRYRQDFLLSGGRWGFVLLLHIFNTYFFLPYWRAFIALLLIVTGLTLFCGLYRKYSNGKFDSKAAAVFTSVAISFPLIADLFIFTVATVEIGLIIVLAGISLFFATIWIIDKRHLFYAIPAGFALGYAIAFYEIAMIIFLIGGFTILLTHFLFSKEDGKLYQFLLVSAKLGLIAGIGLFLWKMGATILRNLYSIDRISYAGGMITHDITSVNMFLMSLVRFIATFFEQRILLPPLDGSAIDILVWCATIALLAMSVVLSVVLKKPAVSLAGIVAVGSGYGMHFVLGSVSPPNRMILTFCILIAFTLALIYMISRSIAYKNIKIKHLTIFVILWVVAFQSRYMNQIFYLDYQRYQRDVMIMNTIISDIGIGQEKPVLFVGLIPDTLPRREYVGYSLFNLHRSHRELWNWLIYEFFKAHNFPFIAAVDVNEDEIRNKITDMPSWPKDGYVREFEYFIIVRLGPSALDRS